MIVDVVVLVVLLISALIAFLRGLIREILTIAGVVGGLAAAYFGGPILIPHMHGWLGVEDGVEPERLFGVIPYNLVGDALSYGVIFVVVVLILSITSHFLAEGAKNLGLGAIDRTLGFIFGIARGVLLVGLLYLPVHLFIDDQAKGEWFETSQTHFYVEQTSAFIAGFLPEGSVDEADDKIETVKELDETRKKLEEINLLKPKDSDQDLPAEAGEGYSDEFRNSMDVLFEKGADAPVKEQP